MDKLAEVARDLRPLVERIGARYGRKPHVHSFPFDEVFVYVFDKRVTLITRREIVEERYGERPDVMARLAEARIVDAYELWRPIGDRAASACK